MTRLIAFDHGHRRIGVAVADTEVGIAFARPAVSRPRLRDIGSFVALARGEGAGRVVVGLPRNMDGSEGSQAAAARGFGEALGEAGLEVIFVDERLTSWEAGERLAAEGRRPSRQTGELDSAAARLILQDYLDAWRAPPPGTHASNQQES